MRSAWILWLAMLLAPMLLLLVVVFILGQRTLQAGDVQQAAYTWFTVLSIITALIIPLSFFLRRLLFKKYFQGRPVSPKNYLAGMAIVWTPLVAIGVASMIACLLVETLIPTIVPAVVAFVLFLALWPNGHAMTRPVGNSEDPSTYEEPR
ncbi:MAG: hypothetical protein ACFCVE_00850 [Phycisphaerae bacterium]